jgi:GH24 family phage-related lysozyme (muramidase)
MSLNTDPVILSIVASQKAFDQSMAALQRSMYADVAKLEKQLNTQLGKAFTTVGRNATDAMKASSNAAGQLSFQLNDIGTSLAGGASPFMVMVQQGSQVVQVFQQLKAQGGSAGSALTSALGMVVNPMSLLINIMILGVGYAASFFSSISDGAERSAEDVAKTRQEVQGIIKDLQLPDAVKGRLNDVFDTAKLKDNINTVESAIKDVRADISKGIVSDQMVEGFGPLINQLGGLGDLGKSSLGVLKSSMDGARKATAEGGDVVGEFTKLLEGLDAMAKQFAGDQDMLDAINAARKAVLSLSPDLVKLVQHENDLKVAQDALTASTRALGAQLDVMKTVLGGLDSAWGSLSGRVGTFADMISKNFQQVQGDIKDAAQLIRDEERFSPKAYMDTRTSTGKADKFRVGYGSDKFVDEMGKIRDVTADTVVTVAQAEADLERRIGEFQATILRQIGPDFWASFNEQQKAALTSIAYNYGNLPPSIVKAIQQGDKGQVAQAISALTANPERRQREAEMFGGGQFKAKDAKTAYDEWTASIQKKTQAQLYENTVNADSTTGAYQKIYAIEKEKAVQEGLAAAKQQGLTVDAALTAQINASADAAARAAANQKLLSDAQTQTNKTSQQQATNLNATLDQLESMTSSGLSSFINDLRHGTDAGEAFASMLDNIIGQLINMAVEALIVKPIFEALKASLTGLTGGGFNPTGKVGLFQSGGVIGASGNPQASVSPGVFAGARSMAGGGMVGDPSAIPIIAHRGEIVIPTKALRKANGQTGGRQGDQINVGPTHIKVDVANGNGTSATTASSVAFGQLVDRTVQGIIVRESRPGGLLRQRQGAR